MFPIFLVVFVVCIVLWLVLTVTGIGPISQYCYTKKDNKLIDRSEILRKHSDMRIITVPGNINSASGGSSYQLMLRYSVPANGVEPKGYVSIPNGLGATLVVIGQMQDRLTEQGFAVLCFDRLGVGFTDDNLLNKVPSASDVVRELEYVMSSVAPAETQWILLGPSMGSIIAQCYIAAYPNKVIGLLNMDGLPYPFSVKRSTFEFAAKIYTIYPLIIWTGVLRPFIGIALQKQSKMFISKAFSLDIAVAQLNQARFFFNISLEMKTMMDCCDFAGNAWNSLNISRLPDEVVKVS